MDERLEKAQRRAKAATEKAKTSAATRAEQLKEKEKAARTSVKKAFSEHKPS